MRADSWRGLIQECQQSNQTVVQCCQTNNINIKTYYYWLRKLRTQALAEKELPVKAPKQPVAFKQLEVKSLVANTRAAVIIHLPQATLEITEGTNQQTIQAVLLAR